MYKKYTGDKSSLQQADIFLVKVCAPRWPSSTAHAGPSHFLSSSAAQLCEIPLLSERLDLLFTIRDFPTNFEGIQPVSPSPSHPHTSNLTRPHPYTLSAERDGGLEGVSRP